MQQQVFRTVAMAGLMSIVATGAAVAQAPAPAPAQTPAPAAAPAKGDPAKAQAVLAAMTKAMGATS